MRDSATENWSYMEFKVQAKQNYRQKLPYYERQNMSRPKVQAKETDEHKLVLREQEHYMSLITAQKEHLVILEGKIKETQGRILEKKKQIGDGLDLIKKHQQWKSHICVLEMRVHQATMRYNKLLSQNQAMRNEIAHLSQQRATWMMEYQRLNRELKQQNRIMDDLVETSTVAYNERSDILKQMLKVHEGSKEDAALFNLKITELKRIIDHESKLRTFLEKKYQERPCVTEKEEEKKTETYRSMYNEIEELTEDSDASKITEKIVEDREENVVLFVYIIELTNKIIWLQERTAYLKKAIEQHELQKLQHDEKCKTQLKELQDEVEQKRSRADALEDQYTPVREALTQRKNAISVLFNQMNCDSTPITRKLGGIAEVTDDNVLQFMAILEERVLESLLQLAQSEFRHAETQKLPSHNPLLASCKLLATMLPTSIETPNADRFPDKVIDGITKPLDQQALYSLVLRRVVKAEQERTKRSQTATPRPRKKVGNRFKSV